MKILLLAILYSLCYNFPLKTWAKILQWIICAFINATKSYLRFPFGLENVLGNFYIVFDTLILFYPAPKNMSEEQTLSQFSKIFALLWRGKLKLEYVWPWNPLEYVAHYNYLISHIHSGSFQNTWFSLVLSVFNLNVSSRNKEVAEKSDVNPLKQPTWL